jgi:hypothetical protein
MIPPGTTVHEWKELHPEVSYGEWQFFRSEYVRMKRIIDKLPHTADGYPLIKEEIVFIGGRKYKYVKEYSEKSGVLVAKGFEEIHPFKNMYGINNDHKSVSDS